MKVLFVDAEPRVLEALERVMFEVEMAWDASFAASAAEALAQLEQGTFDVIVSETRVPGMHGAALLAKVRELYPRVARIVLSGDSDEQMTLKLATVAHQFLAKPCAAEVLIRVISRTRELNTLLNDRRLQAVVGQVGALRSPARLYTELSDLLARDDVDPQELVRVIAQDPALSSKLLQLANSAFFGSSASVSDIETAVLRVGPRVLRNLKLGGGAFESAAAAAASVEASFSVDELQARSLDIARLSSKLVTETEDAPLAFMAGLMSNIGELVLATFTPERLYASRVEATMRAVPAYVAERSTWGVTHAEVGAFLLGLWGVPFRIVEAVAIHHAPERYPDQRFALPQVVWLASCLVEGEPPAPELLERFGATALYEEHRPYYAGRAS